MDIASLLADTDAALHAAALMERAFVPQFGEAWSARDFGATLALPKVEARIAHGPQAPALGFSLVYHLVDEAEILMVAVDPAQRRRGIASALLADLIARAREQRHAGLFLEVRKGNDAAVALYARHGFAVSGRRANYYKGRDGILRDAITMRLDLAPGPARHQ